MPLELSTPPPKYFFKFQHMVHTIFSFGEARKTITINNQHPETLDQDHVTF